MLAAERGGELVPDHFDDLLGRGQAPHDLVREGPLANPSQEVLCSIQGHVRIQQGQADVVEGRIHLFGMQLPSRLELPKDRVQAVAQRVEHPISRTGRRVC